MTNDPTMLCPPRSNRRAGPRRKAPVNSRLLPVESEQAVAPEGSVQLAAAPVVRRRRHPSVEYSVLKGVLTELHRIGEGLDQLALHVERGAMPVTPELPSAEEKTRQAISAIMRRLNGE